MGVININYNSNGIGGLVPSSDFISSFIFDSTVLPKGFSSNERIKRIYSLQDAVNLGIDGTSSDETKATGGKIVINTIGAVGETINFYANPANNATQLLGSYIVKTGDVTSDVANGLNISINNNFASTLFTSTVSGSTVSLVIPTSYGISLNSTGLTASTIIGSTFVTTITQFTAGVGSQIDLMFYTLKSYFTANNSSKVWIGIYDFSSSFDATKIAAIQTVSGGEIKQMGILTKKTLDNVVTIINATQLVLTDQTNKHKPLSVVLGLQPGSTVNSISDLINIRSLGANQVSVTVSNGYNVTNPGYVLKGSTGLYPTDLGELLGHVSRTKVSNSIAWVANNVTQNAEVMFVTGEKWTDISDTVIPTQIGNAGYIFEKQYLGLSGCYYDNTATADSYVSDFYSIERRRTIDKVARISYTTLLPFLSSPIILNPANGQMSLNTCLSFINALNTQLDELKGNAEVSGYKVTIDPSQNILITKNLYINIIVVPVGTTDQITVNLGFALSIQ